MFEKLFLLVKDNAGMAVIDNPVIPVKYHEAVINEASSSIIEVLKTQVEGGKIKDLIKYFKYPAIYQAPVVSVVVNKFANRLNKYYGIEPAAAITTARNLIPAVMQQLVEQSQNGQNTDFGLANFLSKFTGESASINTLVNKLVAA
ncbi:hypothetical protein DJ568_10000 [Mucilaginibacter hurinus]|uniref:Uncharacterized protein n=1 Tax=Mucilaginibacter hurinus TaxID=2201324 RepID=A0A367GPM7_9SPHI|nr:hypothetical protein [Mucilaginibacter hurinus]RCH54806.1 hypothetical protein DJ568_10000 [Mucilaginibacter hurinus]